MKTTLELSDDLMREIKMRAVRQDRKLKDAIAELLRRGLSRKVTTPRASCSPRNPTRGGVDLCDSNVWLALALSKHVHHAAARRWLDSVREPASVVCCRATQQSFLRLITNASVLSP